MFARFFLLFCAVFALANCAAPRRSERVFVKKLTREVERSPVFSQAFTGFALADAETGRLLAASNADKFFTPASTTKILTLYACLRALGDSLPGLQVSAADSLGKPSATGDGLLFRGTADPTFLHPKFAAWQPAYCFLRKNGSKQLTYVYGNYAEKPYGPGWCWDDLPEYYAAPRSPMPFYGNTLPVKMTPQGLKTPLSDAPAHLLPPELAEQTFPGEQSFMLGYGGVLVASSKAKFPRDFEGEVAFGTSPNVLDWQDIGDTLHLNITDQAYAPGATWRTLYSCPVDTVYRRLMHQSDNFVAEQLLLACAGEKFGILRQDTILRWAQDSLLVGLPQRPKWVDGSGLSRYNLNTPRNNVEILRRLWREQPRARLFDLFPAGGRGGTLASWFASAPGQPPYVFAKTGSMSGVFCLSGYVVCRSGKVLIFSFMHNNFVGSNRPWKAETQRFLAEIRDGF